MTLGRLPEETGSSTIHLPDDVARAVCGDTPHQPVHPHRQKLLAASARKPNVAGACVKEDKKQTKKQKKTNETKNTGKSKSKKTEKKQQKAKPKVTVRATADTQSKKEGARIAYNTAKKEFMDGLLA